MRDLEHVVSVADGHSLANARRTSDEALEAVGGIAAPVHEDVAVPEPAAGEVRVRLRVAGVNPTAGSDAPPPPLVGCKSPGQDGAGDVDAVGSGVDPPGHPEADVRRGRSRRRDGPAFVVVQGRSL